MEATRDEERSDVIRVRALGASEIIIGRKTIGLSAEMVFALGFYLCARAGDRLRREAVAELFWGDAEEKRGRHSLRQMLYKLRQKGLTLDEDGDELYLDPARVESDLARALEERWPGEAQAGEILAAGELLPGLSRAAGPRFQEWLDGLRSQLAFQHRQASLRQISLARREARWADLDRWAHQVLAHDPLNEEATFARAESAAMAGSKVVALEILDQYLEELGDRSIQIGLPAKVLRRRIAERRPEWSTRAPREVPLVGRTELMSRLTGLVEEASHGNGSAVVLWGAPGIGKTRLAEETRGYAELAGFRTVTVRATAAGSARPLSVLMALIPQLRDLPGAAGCDPGALAVLDRVVRGLKEQRELDTVHPVVSVRDTVLASVGDLVEAISSECRLLILFDDLHHVDGASWGMLQSLIQSSVGQRVCWLGTSRIRPSELEAFEQPRVAPPLGLHVPPLNDHETSSLAQALRDQSPQQVHAQPLDRLARLSAGNPLFIRELSASHGGTTNIEGLPRSLRALIEGRLTSFDVHTTRVLRVSMLLGAFATVARLRELSSNDPGSLEAAVEHLEQEGVLHLGAARNLDLHECWQHVVSDMLTGATRAILSHQCATLLRAELDKGSKPDAAWRAAELFLEAGDTDEAVLCFVRCAEHTLDLGFPSEAVSILERAYGVSQNSEHRLSVGVRLAMALCCCWRAAEAAELCSQLLILPYSPTPATLENRATALSLRMESLTKCYRDHRDDLNAMAVLARDERLSPHARQFMCLSALRVVFNDGTSDLETHFFETSIAISEVHGRSTTGLLAQLIFCVEHGRAEDVFRLIGELDAHDLATEDSIASRNMALRYKIHALRWTGQTHTALEMAEEAFHSFVERGFLEEAASLGESMTFACLDANDVCAARTWAQRFEESGRTDARTHARSHARSRVHVQAGEIQAALDICLPRIRETEGDFLVKRRVAELAIVAYCATRSGDHPLAEKYLPPVEERVRVNDASCFMDYPAELAIRTLRLLGRDRKAEELATDYASRRCATSGLPIAPYFEEIRTAAARLSVARNEPELAGPPRIQGAKKAPAKQGTH